MTTPRDRTAALMAAMEFTLEDLNHNRNGTLSPTQAWTLGAMGTQQVPFAIVPFIGMAFLTLVSGIAVVYLFIESGYNLMTMMNANPPASTVVAVFIIVSISAVMAYRHYRGSRGLGSSPVHSVEGYVNNEVEGIGPNKQMFRNELGFLVGAGVIGTMFVRNLFRGQAFSTRQEDYMLHYSYRLKVGGRRFHVLKPVGEAFENAVLYRLYYVKASPLPMLISGEALDAPSPISGG
jgi:hypothetical protein